MQRSTTSRLASDNITHCLEILDSLCEEKENITAEDALETMTSTLTSKLRAIVEQAQLDQKKNEQIHQALDRDRERSAQLVKDGQKNLEESQKHLKGCQTAWEDSQKNLKDCQTAFEDSQKSLKASRTAFEDSQKFLKDCQKTLEDSQKTVKDCQKTVKDFEKIQARADKGRDDIIGMKATITETRATITRMQATIIAQDARHGDDIKVLEDERADIKAMRVIVDRLRQSALRSSHATIKVGLAELRLMMIRKLSGKLNVLSKQPASTPASESCNADDRWAKTLKAADFRRAELTHIWDQYARFIQDDRLTAERNANVHRMGMQREFARALIFARDEDDAAYRDYADTYAEAFRWTHDQSIEDAAAS